MSADDDGALPAEMPEALLNGASVANVTRAVAPRPWGNDGQASVDLLTVELSDGATRKIVWKRAQVPLMENRSKREADKRLASFEAEAAFFTTCAPRLAADTPIPTVWSLDYSWDKRSFALLMSNLKADGYPRQPSELSLDLS